MGMIFNKNALRNKFQHYKKTAENLLLKLRNLDDLATNSDKADEASEESFPASDPPGHYSKSHEDKVNTTRSIH
jgi:uncharacterized membrane-anchored protein YhcB (DUF1043 family)